MTNELYTKTIQDKLDSVLEQLPENIATNRIFKSGYLTGLASAGLILETLGDVFKNKYDKNPLLSPETKFQLQLTSGAYYYLSRALLEKITPIENELKKEQTNAAQ